MRCMLIDAVTMANQDIKVTSGFRIYGVYEQVMNTFETKSQVVDDLVWHDWFGVQNQFENTSGNRSKCRAQE